MTEQDSLEQKLQIIKDRVELAINGYVNGFYLWGEGGIGKSYTILQRLDALKTAYVLHNTRLSGRAFFDIIARHPSKVHVVEECENLFTDRQGMNLLRSACWGQKDKTGKQKRLITWNVAPEPQTVEFTGSIIFTGNRALSNVAELRALRTRIPSLELKVTREEMLDLMKRIAGQGYSNNKGSLTAEDCMEIFTFYKDAPHLDLRVLVRAFDEVMGCRALNLKTTWKDMINSAIQESLVPEKTEMTLEEVARDLDRQGLTGNRLKEEWEARTGKSVRTYYRLRNAA